MKLYKKSTEKGSVKHSRMPGYSEVVGHASGTNYCPSCKIKKQLTNYVLKVSLIEQLADLSVNAA